MLGSTVNRKTGKFLIRNGPKQLKAVPASPWDWSKNGDAWMDSSPYGRRRPCRRPSHMPGFVSAMACLGMRISRKFHNQVFLPTERSRPLETLPKAPGARKDPLCDIAG